MKEIFQILAGVFVIIWLFVALVFGFFYVMDKISHIHCSHETSIVGRK